MVCGSRMKPLSQSQIQVLEPAADSVSLRCRGSRRGAHMFKAWYLMLAVAASQCGYAQEIVPPAKAVVQVPAGLHIDPTTTDPCCRTGEGTPVTIEILEPLDSSLLKRGDKFRIRLADPVMSGNDVVLPLGIEGIGEVVHAEKSRGGGKAGELLIAARQLDYQGAAIRLRGLKLGGAGKDTTGAAVAVAIAAGPLALFVQGKEIVIPAGTRAQAKLAQDVSTSSGADSKPAAETTAAMTAISDTTLHETDVSTPDTPTTVTKPTESPEILAPAAVDNLSSPKPEE